MLSQNVFWRGERVNLGIRLGHRPRLSLRDLDTLGRTVV